MNRYGIAAASLILTTVAAGAQAQQGLTAVPQTQADGIMCPVEELRYGIAMSLPDPWMQTIQVAVAGWQGGPIGPYTVMARGKEYISCRWLGNGEVASFGIRRPASDHPPETWPCPNQVDVKVLTSLPAGWVGTTYKANLIEKTQGTVAGLPENQCKYQGPAPAEILYELPVTNVPTVGGLAANPRTVPVMDDLKQTFFVTKAQLRAIPQKVTTSCPAKVRFEGRIAANGAGEVRYRREINGQGSTVALNFASAGEKVVNFDTQVDLPQQQTAGVALVAAGAPSNVVKGSARIVIESPAGVQESNVAAYEVTCSQLAATADLAPTPPPPPAPGQGLAAPQPTGTQPAETAAVPAPGARTARTAVAAEAVATGAGALPDLQITASELNRARPTMLRLQVVNSGGGPSAATRVRVWTSDGKQWYAPVPPLSAGQETWVMVRADVPLASAESVLAKVDDPDRVKESNEENNEHVVK